jgi:hypothetical protein
MRKAYQLQDGLWYWDDNMGMARGPYNSELDAEEAMTTYYRWLSSTVRRG